jgi:hypothetical protein
MRRIPLGIVLGALGASCAIGACALDETGTFSDGGGGPDVITVVDGGPDVVSQDVTQEDVSYDVPDLGVGETEAGLPCTCVSSVPSGYTIVEYVPDQRPTCTTGYGASKDYVENPTSAQPTCGCSCSSSPTQAPTCSCGANPATFNISSGNGNCTDITNESVVANVGSCYKTAQTLTPTGQKLNNMLAAPATPCTASGGQCGTPTKTSTIPSPTAQQGRTCNLSASTASCNNNGVCIPTQGSPFGLCVTNFTGASCPSAFPVAHTVGSAISDTRACSGACSCAITSAGTCGVPQLTLYSGDTNCGNSGSNVTIPADNSTCVFAGYGNGTTFDSARYTITQSGGTCGVTGSSTLTGGLGVTSPFTICCRP